MAQFFHHPVVKGAISGLVAAATTDLLAFKSWHSWHDAVEYSWSTASFRWAQGALFGALAAIGLGAM